MNEQFRRRRFQTDYPVKVETRLGLQAARIIDVNQAGARMIGLTGLQRGDQVQIQVLTDRIVGTVRWSGADRTGISFPIQLNPRLVDTVRQATTSVRGWRHTSAHLNEMR